VDESGNSGVKIRLEAFEGPLDLLLHLIRINEIDIFDIPIVAVTRQYMDYLDLMKEIDIDVGSEFMLMAATLIHIKTKMMLPQREDEEDPRAELVERLLEHQHYKAAAGVLAQREDEELRAWRSPAKLMKPYIEVEEELVEADIFQLISAFQRVMKAIGRDRGLEIEHQHYSVKDKMREIETRLRMHQRLFFSRLMEEADNKRELIAIFLAMLELIRRRAVSAFQSGNFTEIILVLSDTSQSVIEM
jgi:segregation and condensation protein A